MRLLELRLLAYGGLTNTRLAFPSQKGVHVIYGPNEAGKSTALRALIGALYGIPERTPDGWLHGMRDLRVAVVLGAEQGPPATFVRRKGRKDTLTDHREQVVPEAALARWLHGVTSEMFESLFCVNHQALVTGGQALLQGQGELAQSLYHAGAGIRGVRDILGQIQSEAERLIRPRGSAAVNDALAAYEAARKEVREASLPPRLWHERSEQAEELRTAIEAQTLELKELSTQIERLNRYRMALPHAGRYRAADLRLGALADVVLLPATAAQERALAQKSLQHAEEQAQRGMKARSELSARLEGLKIPPHVLESAPTIESLFARLDSYRKSTSDLPRVEAELQEFEGQAQELLSQVEAGLTLDRAAERRLTAAQRAAIKRLSTQFTRCEQNIEATREQGNDAARKCARQQALVDSLPVPVDPAPLQRALHEAQPDRNLEAERDACLSNLQLMEREARERLSGLGLWNGALEEVAGLAVPDNATIDRFENELDRLEEARRQLDRQIQQTQQERVRIAREIQELRLAGDVPTEEQLNEARHRRDQGWKLIRARHEGAANDAMEREFSGNLPLEETYEQCVIRADLLADRLRREAERVLRLARLLSDEEACQAHLHQWNEERQRVEQARQDSLAQWRALWEPMRISPLPPKEMKAWHARLEALQEKCRQVAAARHQAAQLQERIERRMAMLAEFLPPQSASQGAPAATLLQSIAAAADLLERQRNAVQRDATARAELDRLVTERDEAIERHRQAEDALEQWRRQWQEATLPLRTGHARPEEVQAVQERLDQALDRLRQANERRPRIASMREHVERFENEARALCAIIGGDLALLPPDAAVERLNARLTEARDKVNDRRHFEQQLEEQNEALRKAEEMARGARRELEALMRRAGCATLAELEEAERRSEERHRLAAERDQAAQSLAELGSGAPVEQFLAQLAGFDADALAFQLQELEQARARLEARRGEDQKTLGGIERELAAMDGTGRALDAADKAQAALAEARGHAERAARLLLAAGVLRRYLEWYRQRNQSPLVQRASAHFARLTLGSFIGLEVGFDDDDMPVLVGVRANNGKVEVSGMSDGTRDQLFLALRLASLEQQMNAGAKLPLVVDDILINFDDGRAAATLELLAELSRGTQVLFFTHHRRLVELARERLSGDDLALHELG
jgi:uncharacterized protein YhaN